MGVGTEGIWFHYFMASSPLSSQLLDLTGDNTTSAWNSFGLLNGMDKMQSESKYREERDRRRRKEKKKGDAKC